MIWDLDKLALEHLESTPISEVQYARQLIEDGDAASLAEAAAIYQAALADPALQPGPYRAEIQSTYGALLCLQAQNCTDETTVLGLLDQARMLLSSALLIRQRQTMPETWANSSANLALVYITRYTLIDNRVDVMHAHMALDGTLEVFTAAGDQSSRAWVRSLREYLVALVERRQALR